MAVTNLTPMDVADMMARGEVLLIDVREPHEIAQVRIPGAVNVPLSTFNPSALPDPEGKRVVFSCRSGVRSVTASEAAQLVHKTYNSHMAGGIIAWGQAGLPVEQG